MKSLTVEFIARVLFTRGLINKRQLEDILLNQETAKKRLHKLQEKTLHRPHQITSPITPAEIISSMNIEIAHSKGKFLTEDIITEITAEAIGIEYKKIDPLKLDMDTVTNILPKPFAIKHLVVCLEKGDGQITIAVCDPFDNEPVEAIKRLQKTNVKVVMSSKTDILKTIREFYGFRKSLTAAEAEALKTTDLWNLEQYIRLRGEGEIEATDQHIVNAVEYILHYAYDQRASDIHIEPKRDKSFVRFRIDGILHNVYTIPKPIHPPVVSRIKMLSRMDIAEKRKPQDGRIKTHYKGKDIELRVSTIPVAFGEKVVIRIFDPEVLFQELDQLGFYPREYQLYNSFLRRSNGIILVTGPTGSGKTTTLYSSLKVLSSPEVNIITIEDPVEMVVEEFNQIGVQPAIGLTFANILRSVLRQDPDIIMVGEIRDRETAENAVQAALTGHLVLSTLHTNDAPSSIIRLLDLGIPAFLISSTVIGIVAQRLVRKICPFCKKSRSLTDEEREYLQLDENLTVYYGEGCRECRGTGYKGRTGIFEVMDFSDRIRTLLSDRITLNTLYKAAKADGLVNLREVAIKKMIEGITTYEEVIAVT